MAGEWWYWFIFGLLSGSLITTLVIRLLVQC